MQRNQFFDFGEPKSITSDKITFNCTELNSLMVAQKPATSRLLAPKNPSLGVQEFKKVIKNQFFWWAIYLYGF